MDATKVLDDEPGLTPASVMDAADELNAPTHDDIARLAYSYYEARGEQGSSPVDDWLRAERELKGNPDVA